MDKKRSQTINRLIEEAIILDVEERKEFLNKHTEEYPELCSELDSLL